MLVKLLCHQKCAEHQHLAHQRRHIALQEENDWETQVPPLPQVRRWCKFCRRLKTSVPPGLILWCSQCGNRCRNQCGNRSINSSLAWKACLGGWFLILLLLISFSHHLSHSPLNRHTSLSLSHPNPYTPLNRCTILPHNHHIPFAQLGHYNQLHSHPIPIYYQVLPQHQLALTQPLLLLKLALHLTLINGRESFIYQTILINTIYKVL